MEALNHLQSFVLSAELGSFSAAARRLGLTPAAVSKNVARLEASLGLRLFQRSTRRLTLTEGESVSCSRSAAPCPPCARRSPAWRKRAASQPAY